MLLYLFIIFGINNIVNQIPLYDPKKYFICAADKKFMLDFSNAQNNSLWLLFILNATVKNLIKVITDSLWL